MTHRAYAKRTMTVPSDRVWSIVSRGSGMEDWYPELISHSELKESDGLIERACVMADGAKLEERILIADDKTRTFTYSVDAHPLPASNVVGTIRVDGDERSATVTWSAQLTPASGQEEMMVDMVTGMYERGLESLERYASME